MEQGASKTTKSTIFSKDQNFWDSTMQLHTEEWDEKSSKMTEMINPYTQYSLSGMSKSDHFQIILLALWE